MLGPRPAAEPCSTRSEHMTVTGAERIGPRRVAAAPEPGTHPPARPGSLYAALACGHIDVGRLRDVLVCHPLAGGQPISAVDVTTWPRCDAECSLERGLYSPLAPLGRPADRRRLGVPVDRASQLRQMRPRGGSSAGMAATGPMSSWCWAPTPSCAWSAGWWPTSGWRGSARHPIGCRPTGPQRGFAPAVQVGHACRRTETLRPTSRVAHMPVLWARHASSSGQDDRRTNHQ
jgi:hypothetical protein